MIFPFVPDNSPVVGKPAPYPAYLPSLLGLILALSGILLYHFHVKRVVARHDILEDETNPTEMGETSV